MTVKAKICPGNDLATVISPANAESSPRSLSHCACSLSAPLPHKPGAGLSFACVWLLLFRAIFSQVASGHASSPADFDTGSTFSMRPSPTILSKTSALLPALVTTLPASFSSLACVPIEHTMYIFLVV
jgi:hypothetical protein